MGRVEHNTMSLNGNKYTLLIAVVINHKEDVVSVQTSSMTTRAEQCNRVREYESGSFSSSALKGKKSTLNDLRVKL